MALKEYSTECHLFKLLLCEENNRSGLVRPDLLALVQRPHTVQHEVVEGLAGGQGSHQDTPAGRLVDHYSLTPDHPQLGVLPVLVQRGLCGQVWEQILASLHHLIVDVQGHHDGLGLQGPGGHHHHVVPVD